MVLVVMMVVVVMMMVVMMVVVVMKRDGRRWVVASKLYGVDATIIIFVLLLYCIVW